MKAKTTLLLTIFLSASLLIYSCGTQKNLPTQDQAIDTNEDVTTINENVVPVLESDHIASFNVICGSFQAIANAETLKDFLIKEGYHPIIVFNKQKNTFRVVLCTSGSKSEAISERYKFKRRYPDNQDFQKSWILKLQD